MDKVNNLKYNVYKRKLNEELCNIDQFFIINRTCKINLETANQDIIDALQSETFVNNILKDKSITSTQEGNEIFTIFFSGCKETIQLGECENKIKMKENIAVNKSLIIYKHEIIYDGLLIPIMGFEVFDNNNHIDLECCKEISINYYIKKEIKDNFFLTDPTSSYYNDNCSVISNKSLYERKEFFNLNNLSIVQKNCKFIGYDDSSKTITNSCYVKDSNIN